MGCEAVFQAPPAEPFVRQRPPISETEMDVLKALWQDGPGTVREINERLRRRRRKWAYTTVQTLLNRLKEKGYVERDESALAHVFRAGMTREDAYQWVQESAMETWKSGTPFEESVRSRKEITERVKGTALDAVFSLDSFTKEVDAIFDRVL